MKIRMSDLYSFRGTAAVTFTAITDDLLEKGRMRKRLEGEPNPFPGARKRYRVNGMIGWVYANSVNNQRVREASVAGAEEVEFFEPEPRRWGVRVRDGQRFTPLVYHKGRWYLEVKVEKSLGHQYFLDDRLLTDEQVQKWLTKRGQEGARQQVEKVVILRDPALENIEEISFDGVVYDGIELDGDNVPAMEAVVV